MSAEVLRERLTTAWEGVVREVNARPPEHVAGAACVGLAATAFVVTRVRRARRAAAGGKKAPAPSPPPRDPHAPAVDESAVGVSAIGPAAGGDASSTSSSRMSTPASTVDLNCEELSARPSLRQARAAAAQQRHRSALEATATGGSSRGVHNRGAEGPRGDEGQQPVFAELSMLRVENARLERVADKALHDADELRRDVEELKRLLVKARSDRDDAQKQLDEWFVYGQRMQGVVTEVTAERDEARSAEEDAHEQHRKTREAVRRKLLDMARDLAV